MTLNDHICCLVHPKPAFHYYKKKSQKPLHFLKKQSMDRYSLTAIHIVVSAQGERGGGLKYITSPFPGEPLLSGLLKIFIWITYIVIRL